MPGKAYNVLTLSGQLVYLYRIRNCLWHKLNDDEEPAIGVKSSDEKKISISETICSAVAHKNNMETQNLQHKWAT